MSDNDLETEHKLLLAEDDATEHARLTALFTLADLIIDAHLDVLPAAVWPRDDGTLAKAPLTLHGHLDAHQDRQLIRQQIITPYVPARVPSEYEVVVAYVPGSGDFGVLDCDVKHGAQGAESLQALVTEHGPFYGAVWNSPSGGANILFRKAPGAAYSNRSPWAGIDVRADNGWVVAPGNTCQGGAWTWKLGDFTTASPLPQPMTAQLSAATTYGQKATNRQTIAFIEASPTTTTLPVMEAFKAQLTLFRSAAIGNRHPALVRIVGWCCGMEHLDLRWALEKIKDEWIALTADEGREDEVDEFVRWCVTQELTKRASAVQPAQPAGAIDGYRDDDADDDIFIDWAAFAQRDSTARRWLVEEFWPWGRGMALWASAKEGKSELALWCAAKLATGVHPWTGKPIDPVHVAYFDYEMTEDDLDERLNVFDIDVDDLALLHYAILPRLDALDTATGGEALLRHVTRVEAAAVVIDTFGRAVIGEEDKADTVNAFYRHVGSPLKAAGIGYIRTDHAGKDRSKGQRGSSAKSGDVDVIWQQRRTQTGVTLDCTGSSRLSWVGPKLVVERHVNPARANTVSYSAHIQIGVPAAVIAKAAELDTVGVPLDAGRPRAIELLKDANVRPGRFDVLSAALEYRRKLPPKRPGTAPGTALSAPVPGTGTAHGGALDLFTPSDQGK